jgi:hypothetical protein
MPPVPLRVFSHRNLQDKNMKGKGRRKKELALGELYIIF